MLHVRYKIDKSDIHSAAYLVATRDIERGEELAQNYLEFETEDDLKKRGIKTEDPSECQG